MKAPWGEEIWIATPADGARREAGVHRASCVICGTPITEVDGGWEHAYGQVRCWRRDVERKLMTDAAATIQRLLKQAPDDDEAAAVAARLASFLER